MRHPGLAAADNRRIGLGLHARWRGEDDDNDGRPNGLRSTGAAHCIALTDEPSAPFLKFLRFDDTGTCAPAFVELTRNSDRKQSAGVG